MLLDRIARFYWCKLSVFLPLLSYWCSIDAASDSGSGSNEGSDYSVSEEEGSGEEAPSSKPLINYILLFRIIFFDNEKEIMKR